MEIKQPVNGFVAELPGTQGFPHLKLVTADASVVGNKIISKSQSSSRIWGRVSGEGWGGR